MAGYYGMAGQPDGLLAAFLQEVTALDGERRETDRGVI